MSKIILVGTVHIDYKGPERLGKLLKHYGPDIIALEQTVETAISAYNEHVEFMKSLVELPLHKMYTEQQIAIARQAMLSFYYSVWVPKEYKNCSNGSKKVELFCIDCETSATTPVLAEKLEEFVKRGGDLRYAIERESGVEKFDDLIKTGLEGPQKKVDAHYFVKNNYKELVKMFGQELVDILTKQRDVHFASQISKLAERNKDKTIMFIVGGGHIFDNYVPNLFNLLSHLNPERIKLINADKLN